MKTNSKVVAALVGLWLLAPVQGLSATSPAARANNTFGLGLFQKVTKRTDKGNKFLSPVSAYLALSMAAEGTTGITLNEMMEALGQGHRQPAGGWSAANRHLMETLTRNRDFDLSIANSLWAREGFVLKGDYTNRMKQDFGALVTTLDFNLPTAADTINGWVKAQTKGKIDGIVAPPISPDMRLFLINATYFDAKWTWPFEPRMTRNETFTNANGVRVSVPMMSQDGDFAYAKGADWEAVELTYGEDEEASMIAVLPQNAAAFSGSLNVAKWNQITQALDATLPAYGRVTIPSLEFSFDTSLVGALKGLNMKRAFTNAAEFDRLTDEAVAISDVIQKTYVKVFEEGTIAAAVTSIEVAAASIPPQPKFVFEANRPYFFALRDRRTNALLFLGEIQEPVGGKLPPAPKLPGT